MEMSGPLYSHGITTVTHWIGGWMGPRTGPEAVAKKKFLPLPGIEP